MEQLREGGGPTKTATSRDPARLDTSGGTPKGLREFPADHRQASRGRDAEILDWIGRLGAVAIDHVRERFGLGRTVAYRRTAALTRAGLLARSRILHDEPALLHTTPAGLRYVGLPLEAPRLSPGSITHWIACADVWLLLERRIAARQVIGVRELAFSERAERRAIASAKVGELPNGSPRLHRPDLALLGGERPIAVEVELTPKAPQRLARIMDGWRKASCVERVLYVCGTASTRRGVERAVRRAYAEDRIDIVGMGDLASISLVDRS